MDACPLRVWDHWEAEMKIGLELFPSQMWERIVSKREREISSIMQSDLVVLVREYIEAMNKFDTIRKWKLILLDVLVECRLVFDV